MNSVTLDTAIEFVDSPLIPQFLLIQEIGLTISMIFMLMMFRTMLRVDEQSYEELFSPWTSVMIFGSLIIVGFLTYTWGIERFLFAFSLSAAILLTYFRPIFGLASFISFLLYRPWEMMPEPIVLAIPKYFGLLVFGLFILKKFRRSEYFFIWNKECTFMILFALWVLFSVFKTNNFNESLTLYENQFTRLLIIFFLMLNLIKTRLDFLTIHITLVITVVTKGIVSILNTMSSSTYSIADGAEAVATRLTGVGALADSNDLAAVFIISLPLLLSLFWSGKKNIYNLTLGAMALFFSTYLIWLTRSRGAIIALLALFSSFLLDKIKKKSNKIITILLIGMLFFPISMTFKRSSDDLSESTSNRMNYWKTAVIMAGRNPFLGVGYNAYPENFESYAPELISEFGYRTAHSTWFLILGETGFIGFGLFFSLYFVILRKSIALRKDHPELFFSLIGYTVTMTFLSHAYVIYPYILFALVSVGHRIFIENNSDHPEAKAA
ncbi:MAG: O-antigen ligase family protein [Bacteriovoracaceae bacterium]